MLAVEERICYQNFVTVFNGEASPKFGGFKIVDFRKATVFYLGQRFSKLKLTIYAKTVGEPCSPGPLATPVF